jgi:UPF0042 nucleotide-binding protein
MRVKISSFGFKYGEPYPEADLRVDLRRRISNPQNHLPPGLVGTDPRVLKTVLGNDQNQKIFEQYLRRVLKLLNNGPEVTVAFGCKSGIHRSVVFAEELASRLREQGHEVELIHVHLKEAAR